MLKVNQACVQFFSYDGPPKWLRSGEHDIVRKIGSAIRREGGVGMMLLSSASSRKNMAKAEFSPWCAVMGQENANISHETTFLSRGSHFFLV